MFQAGFQHGNSVLPAHTRKDCYLRMIILFAHPSKGEACSHKHPPFLHLILVDHLFPPVATLKDPDVVRSFCYAVLSVEEIG